MPVASVAPMRWKISCACRRLPCASAALPAAKACQRVGLVPWGADLKRKVKRFLVTLDGLFGVAAD